MRADTHYCADCQSIHHREGFTTSEKRWRRKHGVTDRRKPIRNLLAPLRFGVIPPGPHGFDISSYQPAGPNFRAGGRSFAIFKATEGTGYFDPHFNANRQAAHAQGCVGVGLYHFARPGSHSPDAEANYFLAHVGAPGPGEFAVLDYEVPPWSEGWIVRYIQILNQHGWKVAFYTYAGMLGNPTGNVRAATPYLWVAAYSSNPPGADRWVDVGWTLWQHTDGQGSVPGNDGPWDCSVAGALFAQLIGGGQPAPPPPPQSQEEPVGAFALPVLGPGEAYTFRPPPAEHTGGIPFGLVYVSFGADFGDPAVPGASVPLRVANWDTNAKAWVVFHGGGHYDDKGNWFEDTPQIPPLYVPTTGDVVAIQWKGMMTKGSLVHCGRAGRVTPLVEYQAG